MVILQRTRPETPGGGTIAPVQYEDDVQLESPIDEAWALPQPEPTNLIAAWPRSQPPVLDEIVAALSRHFGQDVQVLDELDTDAPEIQWTAALKLPDTEGLAYPIMVWAEPAREGADHPPAAAGCHWVLGIETMLDQDDPVTSHHVLMRTIAGALPIVPAILDINTSIWRDRAELQRTYLAENDIEPPADGLWTIQAVQQQSSETVTNPRVWLHTHGLWRCGLPELEMLEVPTADASAAAMLLNDIAEMTLEQRPSQPEQVYEIGVDLAVTFQPWESVAPFLEQGVPGGESDRQGEHNIGHAGVRAVVCAVEQKGTYRKVWTWPEQVIRQLQSGHAALYMTHRAGQRQAALARSRWASFRNAYAAVESGEADATLLVKVAIAIDTQPEQPRHEHVWFELTGFDGDIALGTLLNTPVGAAMQRGQQMRIDASRVTDWQVQSSAGSFGPEDAERMAASMKL